MFEEINKLNVISRKLTEEDDYLSQAEFDKIIDSLKADDNIDLFLEILNKYDIAGKSNFKYEDDENSFFFPCEIKVNKEDGYYSSSNRDIIFKDSIFIKDSYGQYKFSDRISHTEGKFKTDYLSYVTKVLNNLADNYDFINKESSYSSYYNIYEIWPLRFINEYEAIKAKKELSERITAYYKCRIVNIKHDEEFDKELKELEDFINSI